MGCLIVDTWGTSKEAADTFGGPMALQWITSEDLWPTIRAALTESPFAMWWVTGRLDQWIFNDFYPPSVGSSCELSFHPILGLDLWFAFRVQFCCHGKTDVRENVCCEGTICSAYPFLEVFYPYFLGWITHHNRIYSSWTWVESIWIIYREYSPISQWPGWTAVCRAKSPVLCVFAVHFCGRLSSYEQLGIGDVTMLRFISYHENKHPGRDCDGKGCIYCFTMF